MVESRLGWRLRSPAPMSPSRLALALALVLTACAGDPAPDADPASPLTDVATALTLDADGVGRLGAETPFDTAAVRAALPPGFVVELRSAETEAGLVPVAWALRDGLLVLEVYPSDDGAQVGRIDAASDQVAGPDGARTGQTFAELDGAGMDCEPGEGGLSGRAVCRQGRGESVRYVFAHADADAGGLPSDDQLADALLERLVWTAD